MSIKKVIGIAILKIGGSLWEAGGFWDLSNDYKKLTWYGKLGYNLFMEGRKLIFGSTENFMKTAEEVCNAEMAKNL